MKALSAVYPDVRSKRGKQNIVYQTQAYSAIKEMDRPEVFQFFCNDAAGIFKASMLVEIGRLWDESLIQKMAQDIYDCAKKDGNLSIKEWVKIIRMVRRDWQRQMKCNN